MGGDTVDNPISNGERTKGLNGEADTFEVDGAGIEEIQENVVSGVSLGCFAEDMQLRHTLNTLMISTPVDTFLLCCILLNVAILAIQTPTNTLSAGVNTTFGVVDAILSVVFSVEMILRIFSLGFIMGPTTYLANGWNRLDFIVVMGIWVDAALRLIHAATSSDGEGFNIAYLRTLRALRPLRSLRFFSGIKIIIECLGSGMALLGNVAGLMCFVFILFSCVGLQLFSGATTVSCKTVDLAATNASLCNPAEDTSDWASSDCPITMGSCANGCAARPYVNYTGNDDYNPWTDEIHYQGFDNIGAAMMTLFIAASFDEWPEFADKIRRSDVDLNWLAWGYFALLATIGGLLVTNLFIAVITIAYNQVALKEEKRAEAAGYEKPEDSMAAIEDDPEAEEPTSWFPFIPGLSPAVRSLVKHNTFETFILTVVVLNTSTMALEHHGQTQQWTDTLHVIEMVFLVIYLVEMALKWLGLGFKEYFASGFNCLDFFIVLISLASLAFSNLEGMGAFRMLRILRLTRVARLLRLLKKYDSVMNLLRTVMGSWTQIGNVAFFILVMHIVFAVMGIHTVGMNMEQEGWEPPRENFHTFGRAMMSVYQIFTGEDWSVIMFTYMRTHGWTMSLYFLLVFAITNFVCDSLFVAVILENFETAEEEKMAKQKVLFEKALALKGEVNNDAEVDAKPSSKDTPAPTGFAADIVTKPEFDNFIIAIILLSSLCLAVEGPKDASYLRDKQWLLSILEVLDILFFAIFWVECVLKVLAFGFVGYLRDGWNRLDFFVVVMTTVDVIARIIASMGDADGGGAGFARIFRVFRVLRPLRVASKFENIRVIVDALINSLGAVSATLFLGFFFFFVFAILGTNMFMGRLHHCEADPALNLVQCNLTHGAEAWKNKPLHFDNTAESLQTLFVASTGEGWVEIMNWCIDSAEADSGDAPVYNQSMGYAVYWVIFMFFSLFFLTNLFVGVLVQHFQESSGSSLLTEGQAKWSRFEMMCLMAKMQEVDGAEREEAMQRPAGKVFYPIVKTKIFESAVLVTIVANVVLLLAEHFPSATSWASFLEMLNTIFLVVFTIEIVMQILALGAGPYLKNNWNRLDVGIVVLSWAFTFGGVAVGVQAGRAVRMLRVLLVLKSAMTVRSIVMTLIVSIAPAANVFASVVLVIFVYAIAGMHFYGEYATCDDQRLNSVNNFSNIFNAMMILFQISTGMDWMSIMEDLRNRPNPPSVVFAYFSSFFIVSIFVFINLFVAVLLENFEREFDTTTELDVTGEDLQDLREHFLTYVAALPEDEQPVRKTNCFSKKRVKQLTVRALKTYVLSLHKDSPFAVLRQLDLDVWYNRLLHELGYLPAEVHAAALEGTGGVVPDNVTEMVRDKFKGNALPAGWEKRTVDGKDVFVNHELQKTQFEDPRDMPNILDTEVEFVDVARVLCLLRTSVLEGKVDGGFESLSYGEMQERTAKLDKQREATAYLLITICVRANRAKANPPQEVLDEEGWTISEYQRKANFARWFMINTCVKSQKVG